MTHTPLPPFDATSGPRNARILLVGEAWGEGESQLRKPFVGESGKELFRILGEAMPEIAPELHAEICGLHRYGLAWVRQREQWLEAASIAMTNVLALRPPANKLEQLCGSKTEVGGKDYELPAIARAKYLRPEYLPEVDRLYSEINTVAPNLIVALGNTACWAVLQATNIGSIRGSVAMACPAKSWNLGRPVKVLPTYHPAGVMRQWSWRPIVVADLMKALRESTSPELKRPERTVIVNPTLDEIRTWTEQTLANPPPVLSVDIETGASQIKCIGFARSRSESIVIPFVDLEHADGSYWPSPADELQAWSYVRRLLEHQVPKLGQNFVYDLQYLTRYGIIPANCIEDTMLIHHALFPEMQKGLGFLGSIYTNEASWKLMRRKRPDTEKRDE